MLSPALAYHPSAFPPHPPADYDDAANIIALDQRAFDQLEQTKNHWDRPGWTTATRIVYWLLTFEPDLALATTTRRLHRALARPGLDLIQPADLHITLTRVGQRAEVTERQTEALAKAAIGRLGPQFTLTAHPLAGSAGAIRYSVTPWRPLLLLHDTLTQLHDELHLPGGKPTVRFRPHLGVAYSNTPQAARPLIEVVSRLRDQPPVTLHIGHVDLVELRREPGRYVKFPPDLGQRVLTLRG